MDVQHFVEASALLDNLNNENINRIIELVGPIEAICMIIGYKRNHYRQNFMYAGEDRIKKMIMEDLEKLPIPA